VTRYTLIKRLLPWLLSSSYVFWTQQAHILMDKGSEASLELSHIASCLCTKRHSFDLSISWVGGGMGSQSYGKL